MSELKNNAPAKQGQSTLAYRIIAAIVAVACVAAFFLPYSIFVGTPYGLMTIEKKLYALFELMPDAPYKLWGFIPMFADPQSTLGLASGLVVYALVAALGVAFVFAILAVILGKKSEMFAFLAAIVFTWGAALYMIAVVSISCYLPMKILFDFTPILLAALGSLAFFAILFAKLGKLALLNSARFLLTLGFTVCLFLALTYNYHLVAELISRGEVYKIALVTAVALTIVNAIFATVRTFKKKAFSFDFINSASELVIAGALIIISVTSPVADSALLLLSGIAAGIAVVLFILTFIGVKVAKKKALAAAAAQATEAEETAPAQTSATQAAPAPAAAPAATATATTATAPAAAPAPAAVEDYFAGKQIDKFIKTLSVTERNQFASLYLLKHKDVMPEIPAYQIGGDNGYFFEMVFITLGEYRDEIPDDLLSKMYNHMCVEYPQPDVPAFEE